MKFRYFFVIAIFISGCAHIELPEGGPDDIAPPFLKNIKPSPFSKFCSPDQQILIDFNEVILEASAKNGIRISPPVKYEIDFNWRWTGLKLKPDSVWNSNGTWLVYIFHTLIDYHKNPFFEPKVFAYSSSSFIDSGIIAGIISVKRDTINSLSEDTLKKENQKNFFEKLNNQEDKFYHIPEFWVFLFDLQFIDTLIWEKTKPRYYGWAYEDGYFEILFIENSKDKSYVLLAFEDLDSNIIWNPEKEPAISKASFIVNTPEKIDTMKLNLRMTELKGFIKDLNEEQDSLVAKFPLNFHCIKRDSSFAFFLPVKNNIFEKKGISPGEFLCAGYRDLNKDNKLNKNEPVSFEYRQVNILPGSQISLDTIVIHVQKYTLPSLE